MPLKNSSLRLFASLVLGVLAGGALPAAEPFVYAPEVPRSARYHCLLDGREQVVLDSPKGHIVRAAGAPGVAVEIAVTVPVESVVVRPLALGIKPRVVGNRIFFNLERHASVSVEFNGDLDAPLLLFYDAPVPTPAPDSRTRVFAAGRIHEAGEIKVASGQRVFLEGGAVVRGRLVIENAEDVRVWGPGVLDQSTRDVRKNTLYVRRSTRVVIEDVLLLDTFEWSLHLSFSNHVDIRRVRIVGWRANSDGIDILSSSHVAIADCFLRNADDCIAIKAGKWDPDPDGVMENITVERCVLWNDIPGNAFEIGFELNNRALRGVHFRDCDIIHVLRGAAFSIHNAGVSRVEDISFTDIRVEDLRDEFADLYIGLSIYSPDRPPEYFVPGGPRRWTPREHQDHISPDNAAQWWLPLDEAERLRYAPGRGSISDVRFHRISFRGPPARIVLKGYDADHVVARVSFSEITSEGRPVDAWPADLLRTAHVRDITFAARPSGQPLDRPSHASPPGPPPEPIVPSAR
ncbi:MAG: glycosyl hydrolase family 28 protein [Opitutaceae bacterium]|jgi:hypothetical protein